MQERFLPMSQDELLDIYKLSIEAITDAGRWPEICQRLGDRTGSLFALVFDFDPVTHTAPNFHMPDHLRVLDNFVEAFVSGASQDEIRSYEAIARNEVGDFRSEAELLGVLSDDEIPPNAFRDSYFAVVGARSRGAARLNDIGPYVDSMSLHFAHGSAEIPMNVRPDIALLGPIIGKALEAGRTFRAMARGYETLLDAFDHLDCGAVICDRAGRIMIENQRFQDMVDDGDAVMRSTGAVSAAVPEERARLLAMVSKAAQPDVRARNLILALARRSGKHPVIVKAAPVRSSTIRPDETLSLLVFVDADDKSRLSADGLAAFGVLSPAEVEVCQFLVEGLQTEEIAERRDTGVETTRAQIKSASAKLLCSSRLDIVRLALSTRPPVRDRKDELSQASDH